MFKSRYSLRKKMGLQNLLLKLTEMAEEWFLKSKSFDPVKSYQEKLTDTVKMQGFDFLEKYDSEFILSKKNSGRHRSSVSSGFIVGNVTEIFVVPRYLDQKITKVELTEKGRLILKRRLQLDYPSFTEFADSFQTCAIIERVEDDETFSYVCNCFNVFDKAPSGCKGKICFHLAAMYMRDGQIQKPSKELASNVPRTSRFNVNRRQTYLK